MFTLRRFAVRGADWPARTMTSPGADVEFGVEGDAGGFSRARLGADGGVELLNRLNAGLLEAGVEHDVIAHPQGPRLDAAGRDPAFVAFLGELVHVLHGHAERLVRRLRRGFELVELSQ